MKFGIPLVLLLFFTFHTSAQTVCSELQIGIDYFNLFSRRKSDSYQELTEHNVNLGLKLQTNIYNRWNLGLSFDVYSVLDDARFLKRAHFYGVFIGYEFIPSDKRVNFDAAVSLRGSKFRSVVTHPYYQDASLSLYSGVWSHVGYRLFEKLPNFRIYAGMHLSFPMFRHSYWKDLSGDYVNINYGYLGASYTIGTAGIN